MDNQEPVLSSADRVGTEAQKNLTRMVDNGLFARFLSRPNILDIGYKGYADGVNPITPNAIGIDLDYPGYDGKILPFSDQTQDAVFSSHTLEHIADYRHSIQEWFRVLRVGGYLIIVVPHQFLYERKILLPSRFNSDHKRFYTAASLLLEIEEALDPFSYRIRYLEDNDLGFDYTIPPEKHAGGSYEIFVVLEKIRKPDYAEAVLKNVQSDHAPSIPPLKFVPGEADGSTLLIRSAPGRVQSIAVMKLDHRGDFVLARAALLELRGKFPTAALTLICGPWNVSDAKEMEIFDEVLSFGYFQEKGALDSTRSADKIVGEFATLMRGRKFDIAIDLRVDMDTRHLLSHLDAAQRAGFDDEDRFPFLDIVLPLTNPTLAKSWRAVGPEQFAANIGHREATGILNRRWSYAGLSLKCLIYGPYIDLEAGSYIIEIDLHSLRRNSYVVFDVVADTANIILREPEKIEIQAVMPIRFELQIPDTKRIEFRVFSHPYHFVGPFWFKGCRIFRRGKWNGPHQQELMCMLVSMVSVRMLNPFNISELPT